jgi:hypothetical protein
VIETQASGKAQTAAMRPGRTLVTGLALTVAVLVLTGLYLWIRADRPLSPGEAAPGTVGELLLRLSVADVGQFVSGIAALLAFLWLVLACLQQNTQLRLQREELILQRNELVLQRQETQRLADEAREQLEVLRLTASVARREAFVRLLDLYERKLVQEASHISSITAIDPASTEQHQRAWIEYERGDRNAIFENLIRQLVRGQHTEFLRRIDQVVGGRAYLERFSATVGELLKRAAEVDDEMLALCRSSQWTDLSEAFNKLRALPQQQ